jgi:hypothetical protein
MASWIQAVNGSSSTTQTPAVTITGVTAGNGLIAHISCTASPATVSNVTDSNGGTWTQVPTAAASANTKSTDIWYRRGVEAGSITVTAHYGASEAGALVKVEEWQDLGAHDAGQNGSASTGTAATTASLTTNGASDLLVGSIRGQTVSSVGAGWTGDPTLTPVVEYRLGVAPGSYTATWTQSIGAYSCSIAAFLPVSTPPLAPSGLTIRDSSILTWVNNELGAHTLFVDRAQSLSFTVGLVSFSVDQGTTTYTDDTQAGLLWWYRIRAVNGSGSSVSGSIPGGRLTGASPYRKKSSDHKPIVPDTEIAPINPKFLNYLDGFLRNAEPDGINQSSFINHEFLRHINRLTKLAKPK